MFKVDSASAGVVGSFREVLRNEDSAVLFPYLPCTVVMLLRPQISIPILSSSPYTTWGALQFDLPSGSPQKYVFHVIRTL